MNKARQLTGIWEAVLFAGSQTKLAETLGVTRQSVQEWVKRGYVPNSRVREIEKLYGIPRERLCNPKFLELVGRDDSEE
jgi:DNA-binding transcriptional regulator YdaS (Cro superfamily)